MPRDAVVACDRVSKRYGSGRRAVYALADLTLAVYPAEFVAITFAIGDDVIYGATPSRKRRTTAAGSWCSPSTA